MSRSRTVSTQLAVALSLCAAVGSVAAGPRAGSARHVSPARAAPPAHLPPDGLTRCGNVKVEGKPPAPVGYEPIGAVPGDASATGLAGPATNVRAFNVGCKPVRELIRHWMSTVGAFPQDQFNWYCWRKQSTVSCAFGNGGGAPYFRFTLVPPSVEADGSLFRWWSIDRPSGERLAVHTEPLGAFEFKPCGVLDSPSRCPQVVVSDQEADHWGVMVELWWGDKLREVCWDANGANGKPGSCRFKIPNGTPITFFIAEADRRVWSNCWRRVKGAWEKNAGSPACLGELLDDHGTGKRRHWWAGRGRNGPIPPGEKGIWGEGTFWGRA